MNVAVMAGGEWQFQLVKYLKERGYFVYCVNPVESPTTRLADEHIKIDIKEEDKVFEEIKELDLSFIVSDQSEITPLPVARLSKRLGLPGNDPEVIRRYFINKYTMMRHARGEGILIPWTEVLWTPEERSLYYPFILKPVDSHSSRGFCIVNDPSELNNCWEYVTKYTTAVLAQSCVQGMEVTIEGFMQGGKHHTLATSRKTHFRPGIASSLLYPSELPEHLLQSIIESNDRYVESTGLKFGITHAEYMVDVENDKAFMIEVAARGGGSNISSIITPWVSGIHNYDLLHGCLVNKPLPIGQISRRAAILKFYEFKEGIAAGDMEIEDEVKAISGVSTFRFNFTSKQHLYPANSDQTRHASVIILGQTINEVKESEMLVDELLEKKGWQYG